MSAPSGHVSVRLLIRSTGTNLVAGFLLKSVSSSSEISKATTSSALPPRDELGITPLDELGITPLDELGITPLDELGIAPLDELGITPTEKPAPSMDFR